MNKYQQEIKPTLVLMVAGMSRRYLESGAKIEKQSDPLISRDTPIWAYSVYDAVKYANFSKLSFIIRRDFENQFMDEFGNRIGNWAQVHGVDVAYCYQKSVEEIRADPEFAFRTKMWGTAEAMLCAEDIIKLLICILSTKEMNIWF